MRRLDPSPLWGEGRVRGKGRVRGHVRETPRRYAKRLRKAQTDAEGKLWWWLRDRQLRSAKFRRQHPIGPYIADLCCPEAKLVIEIDGGQHAATKEADTRRTGFLEARGYRVLRFWDNEVLANTEGVLERVFEALEDLGRTPHPNPLPKGERAKKRQRVR